MKSVNIPKFWCVGDNKIVDVPTCTEAVVCWSDKHIYPSFDLPVYLADDIRKLVEIVKSKAVDISEIE
jgi:hypothetical protein